MELKHLISRKTPAVPWQAGEKIPWNDLAFSSRMLSNHLSQDHDWASRRLATIDQHIAYIDRLLAGERSRILDLGCGPGFYTHGLAKLGHQCTGVDFSPASIRYAKEAAARESLSIRYELADVREFAPPGDFDLVMMLFGEFNVFREEEARRLIDKAAGALKSGGKLLVEVSTFESIVQQGQQSPTWEALATGLFSDAPHLYLQENFWDESSTTATTRYTIIDAETATVREYGSSSKAYSPAQYAAAFSASGLGEIAIVDSSEWLTGEAFVGALQTYCCARTTGRQRE